MAQEQPIFIPPPPLPEFYMTKKSATCSSASTSSSAHDERQLSGSGPRGTRRSVRIVTRALSPVQHESNVAEVSAWHECQRQSHSKSTPPAGEAAQERLWFNAKINQHYDDVPPLAVYHICRLCLRPRSAQYHREHPIPIDGMPPPPGICRRCRVTSIEEETHVVNVVDTAEKSEDVRLGVRCLVPDEDYISHEEMMKNLPIRIRKCDSQRPVERKDITYRHVRVIERSPERSPHGLVVKEKKKSSKESKYIPSKPAATDTGAIVATSLQVEPARTKVSESQDLQRLDGTRASVRVKQSYDDDRKSSAAGSEIRVDLSTSRTQQTESDMRRLAREEIDRHPQFIAKLRQERTDSEIRRIARDEVERYRQAERKIEAHGRAFAHGRMVPVQRQIAAAESHPKEKPWITEPSQNAWEVKHSSRRTSCTTSATKGIEELVNVSRSKTVSEKPEATTLNAKKYVNRSDEHALRPHSDKTEWISNRCAADKEDLVNAFEVDLLSPKPRFETIEVTGITRKPQTGSSSNRDTGMRKSGSRRSDQEYWSDEQPAWTAESRVSKATISERSEKLQGRTVGRGNKRDLVDIQCSAPEAVVEVKTVRKRSSFDDERNPSSDAVQRSSQSPPHSRVRRRDSVVASVPQKPEASSLQEKSKSIRPEDQSYLYVERTRTTVKKPRGTRPFTSSQGDSYIEKEVLLRRKTPAKVQTGTASTSGSGRVRFSNRIEVSPTPPGSDASSSRFRDDSRGKGTADPAKTSAVDHRPSEHRGRSRSRASSGQTGYIYEQDSVSVRERVHPSSTTHQEPTSKTASTRRHPSTSTETATQASNSRPLTRAFCESPSRERLRLAAAKDAQGASGPPYANPDDQLSDDLEAQDGSEQSDDERRKRHSRSYRRNEDSRRGKA